MTEVTRRDVLVAGLVTIVAAGGGSVVAARDPWDAKDGRPLPPQQLVDALAAESVLIARIDRSVAADPSLRRSDATWGDVPRPGARGERGAPGRARARQTGGGRGY